MTQNEPLYGWLKSEPPRPWRKPTPPLDGLLRRRPDRGPSLAARRRRRSLARLAGGFANGALVAGAIGAAWLGWG